ncbi:MAG: hypothetical protein ACJ74L_03345, partial [Gaiellaceae bacterium]
RSIEDLFGLEHLGYAESPDPGAFGSDVFTRPEGVVAGKLRIRVRPRRVHVGDRFKIRAKVNHPATVRLRGACGPRRRRTNRRERVVFRHVVAHRTGACRLRAKQAGFRTARKRIHVRR